MTKASRSTVTVKEHYFTVPEGGDMKDLGLVLQWAQKKAMELDLDIGSDDWARITIGDEEFSIVVIERIKD